MRTQPTSLSRTALAAVAAIAGLAYAISYASLYDLATRHNFGGPANWESIAWPFSVDLASFSTGAIALDRANRGKSAVFAGTISAVAAGLMIGGNILANVGEPAEWGRWITVGMHAWLPSIALACGYMLVRARRDDANDRGLLEDESQADEPEVAQNDSQPPPPGPRPAAAKPNPRVLRLARDGANWKQVAAATKLSDHAAKRALTAARKQIASEAQPANAPDAQGVAA